MGKKLKRDIGLDKRLLLKIFENFEEGSITIFMQDGYVIYIQKNETYTNK